MFPSWCFFIYVIIKNIHKIETIITLFGNSNNKYFHNRFELTHTK